MHWLHVPPVNACVDARRRERRGFAAAVAPRPLCTTSEEAPVGVSMSHVSNRWMAIYGYRCMMRNVLKAAGADADDAGHADADTDAGPRATVCEDSNR